MHQSPCTYFSLLPFCWENRFLKNTACEGMDNFPLPGGDGVGRAGAMIRTWRKVFQNREKDTHQNFCWCVWGAVVTLEIVICGVGEMTYLGECRRTQCYNFQCYNFRSKVVQKGIIDLDSSQPSRPYSIPVVVQNNCEWLVNFNAGKTQLNASDYLDRRNCCENE